jgi:hypothetical protein
VRRARDWPARGAEYGPAPPGSDSDLILGPAEHISESRATFDFDGVEQPGEQALSVAERASFEADFRRECARLATWAAEHEWQPASVPRLSILVSAEFRISRSLIPAWHGYRGRMEFPAWRVRVREAAILHELTHVFFPNGNRLLAEGLAVDLQASIGGNPAFPNFGAPLHALARQRLRAMVGPLRDGTMLDAIDLSRLDAIPTPRPLELAVGKAFYGEEPRGQAHLYPLAGSFVRFLIDRHGMPRLRALYARTPLLPRRQDSGSPARWRDVYGRSLGELEHEWKSFIAGEGSERVDEAFHRAGAQRETEFMRTVGNSSRE